MYVNSIKYIQIKSLTAIINKNEKQKPSEQQICIWRHTGNVKPISRHDIDGVQSTAICFITDRYCDDFPLVLCL